MDYLYEMRTVYEDSLRQEGMDENKITFFISAFETGFMAAIASQDDTLREEMFKVLGTRRIVN